MDDADVDDYFYAFDKEDWTSKKYFENISKQKPDVIPGTNTCKEGSWDYAKNKCATIAVSTDVINGDLEIDLKTIDFYKQKLKSKYQNYNEGIIILSDYESPSQTAAFSRTSPLDHYALFVYSNGIEKKENYAHEIGHMLGLPHSFYTDKEKEAYKNAKESILGNGLPEKDSDDKNNDKYRAGINKSIQKVKNEAKVANLSEVYSPTSLTAIKNDVIIYLNNFNEKYVAKLRLEKIDKKRIETTYVNYKDNDMLNKTQTKGEYIGICNKNIKKWSNYIEENKKAIIELKKYQGNKFETVETNMNFIRPDYIKILEQTKIYFLNVIAQVQSNYILFEKSTTENIMDYDNDKKRYLHNQIRIMRSDIINY